MKKIGIDARLLGQTGVGTYTSNLLMYLQDLVSNEMKIYVYLMAADFENIHFKNRNFIKRKANYRWHSFSEQVGLVKTLYEDNLDLMHFTYFSYPLLYRRTFISTIHDVTPLLFKTGKASTKNLVLYELKHFFFRWVITSQIKNAQAIITPTQTVKKQIIEKFGQQYKGKIFSLYEGVNGLLTKAIPNGSLKKRFKNNFFIYVGNFYPHKNVERLIDAFSQIKDEVSLIFLGPNDFFSQKLLRLIDESKQKERILFYYNPTKEDLVFFYKNALALIHPSLSEGFGLPLVEAAYFGLPVIASNIPVFQEVLDGQYTSFNPTDREDIQSKIESFLKNRLKVNYQNILKKYSFKTMAAKTLKIYKQNLG